MNQDSSGSSNSLMNENEPPFIHDWCFQCVFDSCDYWSGSRAALDYSQAFSRGWTVTELVYRSTGFALSSVIQRIGQN